MPEAVTHDESDATAGEPPELPVGPPRYLWFAGILEAPRPDASRDGNLRRIAGEIDRLGLGRAELELDGGRFSLLLGENSLKGEKITDAARVRFLELLQEYCIPHQRLPTLDPNAASVVAAIRQLPQSILVYSGPGGVILRKDILSTGKRFLHVHSGILPYFRGSTTVYYALLEEGRCGATAFFFDEKIDTGPVIRTRAFPPPEDRTSLDLFYDPLIRSQLLVDVLRDYAATGKMPVEPQDPEAGETYFVIHPVLKHIAILAGESKAARASGATVQD